MKKLVVLLLVGFVLYGFSCSNSGGGHTSEQREFYIEDYQIKNVWYYCWAHLDQPYDGGSGSGMAGYFEKAETEESDEIAEEDSKMYLLQPGNGYMLFVDYFNDKEEIHPVSWIAFEVFVDGERYSSSGVVVEPDKMKGEKASILLFNPVPWHFEGKEVVIDVWLEDATGFKSEVFSFQVAVYRLWYPLEE